MSIHCLHEGLALCGMEGIPDEWPEGHRWLSKADWPAIGSEHRNVIEGDLCAMCDLRARGYYDHDLGPLPDAAPRIDAEEERQRLLRNAPRYERVLKRLKQRTLRVTDLVKAGDPSSMADARHVLRSMVELVDVALEGEK